MLLVYNGPDNKYTLGYSTKIKINDVEYSVEFASKMNKDNYLIVV